VVTTDLTMHSRAHSTFAVASTHKPFLATRANMFARRLAAPSTRFISSRRKLRDLLSAGSKEA